MFDIEGALDAGCAAAVIAAVRDTVARAAALDAALTATALVHAAAARAAALADAAARASTLATAVTPCDVTLSRAPCAAATRLRCSRTPGWSMHARRRAHVSMQACRGLV